MFNSLENLSKEEYVILARMCEQTERFQDMFEFTKRFLAKSNELDSDERQIFANAFKIKTSHLRAELRGLVSIEQNLIVEKNEDKSEIIKQIKSSLVKELIETCQEVLNFSEKWSNSENLNTYIFYLKLRADFSRYLIEFSNDFSQRGIWVNKTEDLYQSALILAKDKLSPIDSLHLTLILNASVFYFENSNQPGKAILMLQNAIKNAVSKALGLKQTDFKECSAILQLMRDNITLWTSDNLSWGPGLINGQIAGLQDYLEVGASKRISVDRS